MPKSRALRRIDRVPGSGTRNVAVTGVGAGGTVIETPNHQHDIYTTDGEVNALIAAALASYSIGDTWTIESNIGTIDVQYASSDSTLYITNSDPTYKANLSIEGDLTVFGNIIADAFEHDIIGDEHTATAPAYSIVGLTAENTLGYLLNVAGDGIDILESGGLFTFSVDETFSYHWTGVHYHDNVVRSETQASGTPITGWKLDNAGRADLATIYTNIIYTPAIDLSGDMTIVTTGSIKPNADTTTLDLITNAAGTTTILRADTTNNEILVPGKLGVGASSIAPSSDIEVYAASARVEIDASTGNPSLRFTRNTAAEWDILYDVANTRLAFNEVGVGDVLYLKNGGDAQFVGHLGIGGDDAGYDLRVVGTTNITSSLTVGGALGVTGAGTFATTVNVGTDLSVGDDLTVTDAATINGLFTAAGDVVLPFWEIDSATGTMQTTGAYAFVQPGALQEYEGIRLQPENGAVEARLMSSSYFAAETLVFEQVTVNAGDLIIAKSGGRLAQAATFSTHAYLVDESGNRIVDDAGNPIVVADAGEGATFTIVLEDPLDGEYNLLSEGDQIIIAGRPTAERWAYGVNFPHHPIRFYPAAPMVATSATDLPVRLKFVVQSVSSSAKNTYTVTPLSNLTQFAFIEFPKGSAVASFGRNGDAYISLKTDTRTKTAFMDIGTVPGTAWENDLTPFIRLGDIGGLPNVADPSDVGLVGGDINNGTDAYFKIAQSGIVLHNGDHVITGDDNTERVVLGVTGLNLKIYNDDGTTDLTDYLSNDEIFQSSIVWTDDPSNPDDYYGAVYAYATTDAFGRKSHRVGLSAEYADYAGSYSASLTAGAASVVASQSVPGTSILSLNSLDLMLLNTATISILASSAIHLSSNLVTMTNIPTSSTDLPRGAIWNDSGTLKVVT